MNIQELKEQSDYFNIFIELAKIPSPSLGENKVRDKIIEFLAHPRITTCIDNYGNIIAKLHLLMLKKNHYCFQLIWMWLEMIHLLM